MLMKNNMGTGKMAQQLETLAVLADDLGSIGWMTHPQLLDIWCPL